MGPCRLAVRLGRIAWLLLLVSAPSGAAGQTRDPTMDWRTLDTPHFTIHYHVPLGVLARRVAVVAERAHTMLTDVMGYTGGRRTHIALTDGTDGANGSAIGIPFNVIRLNATAPESMTPLGDYDDWLNLLTVHEHTHIVHLDQWSGLPAFVNLLLGKVYAPNHVQPRWIVEGIATWQESQRTAGGRLRSTMFDMYLRMDALEDRFLDLDQLTTIADRWPHGNIWYLYGSRFIEFVADRYGREAIATISREYGDAVIPWGLNRVARRATGRGWTELYDDFLAHTRARYEAQRDEVVAAGRVEGTRLTSHGEIARLPRFVGPGRVAYWRADNRSRPRVVAFDLDRPDDQETWARVTGDPGWSLHPSGSYLVLSAPLPHRDIYAFHDLVRQPRDDGAAERLTDGLRAREPDVSPDGRRVAFTTNEAGTTHLWIAELRDVAGTARALLESERFDQVFDPRFSPDGRTIAISRWQHGGYRDVQLVDVESGRVTAVTRDRALDTNPVWSPDGRTLYFSSDRTGIANIYAYRLASGTLRQITNVLGGAYQPAISPDGRHLVYVGYTSFGFDLFALDLSGVESRPARPYEDRRPPPVADDALWAGPTRDYDPLETLYPRSYLLDLSNDGFGPALGITLSGEDLAGWHRYDLRAMVGVTRGDVNFDAVYSYRRTPVDLDVSVFRRVAPRGGLVINGVDERWIEHVVGGEAHVGYRFPGLFHAHRIDARYRATYVDTVEPFTGRLDPNEPPPRFPELGLRSDVRLSWSYSDVERYGYDISPSAGRSFGVQVALAHPLFGSRWTTVEMTWNVRQYVPLPWLESHVLALAYTGGMSAGDPGRRGNFALGGFPDGNPIDGLVAGTIFGGVALRGYPAFDRGGDQYHLVQAEYRFLIWRINRGISTLPVYLNRLHATVFADAGDAFFGPLDFERFRVGVGASLHLDFTLGYFLPFTLRVGYARGLMEGGIDQLFGHIGVPF
ncbi:MAG: PD40 domain-containing protein [Sandaracinaceae bacterium]|nr:PD40 domain-containing protein [Sandaracinaceae bacterium]